MFTDYSVNFSAINTPQKIVLSVWCIMVMVPFSGFVTLCYENQG